MSRIQQNTPVYSPMKLPAKFTIGSAVIINVAKFPAMLSSAWRMNSCMNQSFDISGATYVHDSPADMTSSAVTHLPSTARLPVAWLMNRWYCCPPCSIASDSSRQKTRVCPEDRLLVGRVQSQKRLADQGGTVLLGVRHCTFGLAGGRGHSLFVGSALLLRQRWQVQSCAAPSTPHTARFQADARDSCV